MEGANQEHLLQLKRQASLSGSSSADGELAEASCTTGANGLYCPYCYEDSLDMNGLLEHVVDGHGFAHRSVKCPICRRPARDMIQHLLHHAQSPSQTTSSQPGTPLTSRSAKEWLASPRPGEQGTSDWDSYSEGSTPRQGLQAGSKPSGSQLEIQAPDLTSFGLGHASLGASAAGVSFPIADAGEPPPSPPRQPIPDSSEMRVKFLEQLLLSAFELDWR